MSKRCVNVEVINYKSYTDSEKIEFMIKQLKKKIIKSGMLGELKKRKDFESKKLYKKIQSKKRYNKEKRIRESVDK